MNDDKEIASVALFGCVHIQYLLLIHPRGEHVFFKVIKRFVLAPFSSSYEASSYSLGYFCFFSPSTPVSTWGFLPLAVLKTAFRHFLIWAE